MNASNSLVDQIDTNAPHNQSDLSRIYSQRFQLNLDYRKMVWRILVDDFFSKFIPRRASVLDLGCGYGEFINNAKAEKKFAMDLNPDAQKFLGQDVVFLHQDCSQPWPPIASNLDLVFSSNFFEHLPDKISLGRTLDQVYQALKPGGFIIAMGPNARYVAGAYWDFWDHYLPLTDRSLGEALENRNFQILQVHSRFLPYTMSRKNKAPNFLIKAYLRMPILWKIFGHQFLIVAKK
jgi:SAM-dependent methyltransferase